MLGAQTAQGFSTAPVPEGQRDSKIFILQVPTCEGDVSGQWVKKGEEGNKSDNQQS